MFKIKKFLKICFIFLMLIIVFWFFSDYSEFWPKKEVALSQELEEELENFEFTKRKIRGIKEIDGFFNKVILKIENGEENGIWLFDLADESWQKISFGKSASLDLPIAIKDNYIFWLSEDKETIFAFDFEKGIYYEKPVSRFDPANGERAEIKFPEIPWKVIFNGENFYFWSKETGEIFPDGDSAILENFRKKINLDYFLTNEKLGELGFSIEVNE